MKYTILLTCLTIFNFYEILETKYQRDYIHLSSFNKKKWQYAAKFAYGIGSGTYSIRARLLKPIYDMTLP